MQHEAPESFFWTYEREINRKQNAGIQLENTFGKRTDKDISYVLVEWLLLKYYPRKLKSPFLVLKREILIRQIDDAVFCPQRAPQKALTFTKTYFKTCKNVLQFFFQKKYQSCNILNKNKSFSSICISNLFPIACFQVI